MTEPEHIEIEGRALLLYDGVCALCNGVVQFFLKHDKLEKLRYAHFKAPLVARFWPTSRSTPSPTESSSSPTP